MSGEKRKQQEEDEKEDELELLPYQKIGIERILHGFYSSYITKTNEICTAYAFLLYDEMGLGKTIQALSVLSCNRKPPFSASCLVVCPSTVKHTWLSPDGDLKRYFKDDFANIVEINNKKIQQDPNTLFIISYERLVTAFKCYKYFCATNLRPCAHKIKAQVPRNNQDLANLYCTIFQYKWDHIIFDEVHKVKNSKSTTSIAVCHLQAMFKLGLTGTPMMNSPKEMLTIFKYALTMKDLNYKEIMNRPKGQYAENIFDTFTLGRQRSQIVMTDDSVITKRFKQCHDENVFLDWGNDNNDEICKMTYERVEKKAFKIISAIQTAIQGAGETDEEFKQRTKKMKLGLFPNLQDLRQACLSPNLISHHQDLVISPKMQYLLDYFESMQQEKDDDDDNNNKLIVASSFRQFLEKIISPWLDSLEISHLIYCGGDGSAAQQQVLDDFKSKANIKILLLVKQAGGIGLNLQEMASTMIVMDPHYNKALDDQVVHRINRIGQTKQVNIKRLFMRNTIDDAMLEMQEKKCDKIQSMIQKTADATAYETVRLYFNKKQQQQAK